MQTTRRFGLGSLLTVTGAILILAALPMTWYRADRAFDTELTGWGMFTNLRFWLVATAVLAVLTTLLPRGGRAVAARAVLGLLAGAPVLRRIIDKPDAAVGLDTQIGLYVALLGAVAVILGGLLSAGRAVADEMGWDIPGMGAGPGRALPPGGPAGAARATPQEEPTVIEAEVVEER